MAAIRLQKFLAQAGLASRRKSEDLIAAGRVKVNGQVVKEMGSKVDPSRDQVQIDGKQLKIPKAFEYILFHKPPGYLVTREDTHQRTTIYSLLPSELHHLNPVGRLDKDSSGLLILTNDGDFTNRMLHPRYKVEKVYRVLVEGKVTPTVLTSLRQGVALEDGVTAPAWVKPLGHRQEGILLEFKIREGKKRQIRRMCQAFHLKVLSLHRVRIGPLSIEGLARSQYRPLDAWERKELLPQPYEKR